MPRGCAAAALSGQNRPRTSVFRVLYDPSRSDSGTPVTVETRLDVLFDDGFEIAGVEHGLEHAES